MRIFSNSLIAALVGTALISSCSRPVAYFQPTAHEQFKTAKTETVVVAPAKTMNEVAAPEVAVAAVETATPAQQVAQAQKTVSQLEAYVRNDSKLASNKKLAKRMNHVNQLLVNAAANPSAVKETASTKTSLIQKVMLNRMDKKIKNHLSPERTMAKSLLTIGLIVGVIGLLFIILNVAAPLGVIALVVGLALILVDLLR